ncbi:MAG TPA: adenylate/guanylate cyclase domain-containing protein [Candidatus Limnocylindria bacterium]|nr:adenylate/guanylate cyclase domain-containing protein [Candidatus Limnocylindria bacterium]
MPDIEGEWRSRLLGTNPALRAGRNLFRRLPAPPRCDLCAAPFAGPIGRALRPFGKAPWPKNPRYCVGCCAVLLKHRGGAEVPLSMLFADVRGSTPLGERIGPRAVHDVMDRFYNAGIDELFRYGAIVDRFMGDQVVGYFTPGFAGHRHARQAILAGLGILRATGHDRHEPWIPVGVGVNTGVAFVGAVGKDEDIAELTALGEDVNVAARLASVAAAGELVVSEAAFDASALEAVSERRTVELRGVSAPVAVRVLRVNALAAAPA